jgi:hypothetical protein
VSGSVAWPVRIPPKFSPITQMAVAMTMLRISAGRVAAGT